MSSSVDAADLRRRLIEGAAHLVRDQGPSALSARRLATAFRLAALETADVRSPSTGVEPGLALAALREHDLQEAMLALEDLLVPHAAPRRGREDSRQAERSLLVACSL